ncbi:MAG: 30S ribosomal protein S15 [Dehalococcoidia bacterium]|nr:30S ribosomal protein S15 [Dehalococcoidia bacterium]
MEKERKQALLEGYKVHTTDSGSADVQVALLTERIRSLTEHMKAHSKDFHSQRGLLMLIGHRRRLLTYLNRTDVQRYRSLIARLGLRK